MRKENLIDLDRIIEIFKILDDDTDGVISSNNINICDKINSNELSAIS
jgi:hypothetical protein